MIRRARLAVLASSVLASSVFASLASVAAADVTLGSFFSDHMVLQRGIACPIWGLADAGATIDVSIDGKKSATTHADEHGQFHLKLPTLDAPGPYTIVVNAGKDSKTLSDVLVGDVWICSGQSNMQWNLSDSNDADKEVANATQPNVRLYYVPRVGAAEPVTNVKANWTPCTPETAKYFSAVAYFFGRDLNRELNVPIGLIHTSWGGTPAESWTPLAKLLALKELPDVQAALKRREMMAQPGYVSNYPAERMAWLKAAGKLDPGIDPKAADWKNVDVADPDQWKTMSQPGDWIKRGEAPGCIWFRKEIDVPADRAGEPLTLSLGPIDDYDTTYFNGETVGGMSADVIDSFNKPRKYEVPGKLVKAGRNVIAVRVYDVGGGAGFMGQADAMTAKGGDWPAVSLAGDWKYRRESTYTEDPQAAKLSPPAALVSLDDPQTPSSLYNGMIAPLNDFSIKGAIWYQGENNATRYPEYASILETMITAWREQFAQGDFPFYIVGLANYMAPTDNPNMPSAWAGLRQAQRQVAHDLKNVATTVTIDIGDEGNIHPRNKQEVGRRLALVALADTYGKKLVSRGPTLSDVKWSDSKVVLEFENVGGGLKSIHEPLDSFALAGEDGKFFWADAKIDDDGDEVILTSPHVTKPTRVRYAWADNPKSTLYNADGLPAEPFEVKK